MPRYGQLVMGPAGSGKSTYCSTVVEHCQNIGRSVYVVSLDPAAENFSYPVLADVRELVELEDVMEAEDMRLGPNGGLIFCMEYLVENLDWLEEKLGQHEDDYVLFDCPGQIELYTHIPVMRRLVDSLHKWDFRLCGVFLVDSQFLTDASKFFSGVMSALSAMLQLEIPHVNVMSKMDLLDAKSLRNIERYLDPDVDLIMQELTTSMHPKHRRLNEVIGSLIENYSLVTFLPLDKNDEESITNLVAQIDHSIQYGEDAETKEMKDGDGTGQESSDEQ
eukprot:gene15615-17190_t